MIFSSPPPPPFFFLFLKRIQDSNQGNFRLWSDELDELQTCVDLLQLTGKTKRGGAQNPEYLPWCRGAVVLVYVWDIVLHAGADGSLTGSKGHPDTVRARSHPRRDLHM